MSNCSFNYLGTHAESCIYFFVLQNKILNETDNKQSNKKKIHQIALNIRNLAFLCIFLTETERLLSPLYKSFIYSEHIKLNLLVSMKQTNKRKTFSKKLNCFILTEQPLSMYNFSFHSNSILNKQSFSFLFSFSKIYFPITFSFGCSVHKASNRYLTK